MPIREDRSDQEDFYQPGRRIRPPKPNVYIAPKDLPDRDLDEFEILFVESYCTNGCDAKRAAKESGYKNAQYGYELLRRPVIARAIYDRMRFDKLAAPEIINRVGQLARADMKHYLKVVEVETGAEEDRVDAETGEVTRVKLTRSEVIVDLVKAMQDDNTYPLKTIEFYDRSGRVKKITIEDRLEAIKLIGAAYGLFGNKNAGDDSGRNWFERARDMGIDPRTALEEMMKIAEEWKVQMPKELIDGQFKEAISQDGAVEIEFANPDAIVDAEDNG